MQCRVQILVSAYVFCFCQGPLMIVQFYCMMNFKISEITVEKVQMCLVLVASFFHGLRFSAFRVQVAGFIFGSMTHGCASCDVTCKVQSSGPCSWFNLFDRVSAEDIKLQRVIMFKALLRTQRFSNQGLQFWGLGLDEMFVERILGSINLTFEA